MKSHPRARPVKVYSPRDLASADGKSGNSAFVAVDGKVYDLSGSKRWIDGSHMKMHHAGTDLSCQIKAAPHGPEVLDRFQVIGSYGESDRSPSGLKGKLELWLDRHPFFRRHPHPAIVHVPVGVLAMAPLMEMAALFWRSPCTEWAAYCCALIGVITTPAAMASGYFTWWLNYEGRGSQIVDKKRRLAWIALVLGVVAVVVRSFAVDQPLAIDGITGFVYLPALLGACALVGVVGYLGGKLTFPY